MRQTTGGCHTHLWDSASAPNCPQLEPHPTPTTADRRRRADAWALLPGRGQPTEAAIKDIAQGMIDSGLRDAGYVYMGIGEAGFVRNVTDGQLTLEFPQHWTDGNLRHIASWLHERGFKFSLGISPGNTSCTGEVGVCGPRPHNETLPLPNHCHAQDDVRWTVAQGTDHFPSDWCQILPTQTFAIDQYRQIWQAIESTGRNVTFGMYIYGEDEPWTWAPREHGTACKRLLSLRFHADGAMQRSGTTGGWGMI